MYMYLLFTIMVKTSRISVMNNYLEGFFARTCIEEMIYSQCKEYIIQECKTHAIVTSCLQGQRVHRPAPEETHLH